MCNGGIQPPLRITLPDDEGRQCFRVLLVSRAMGAFCLIAASVNLGRPAVICMDYPELDPYDIVTPVELLLWYEVSLWHQVVDMSVAVAKKAGGGTRASGEYSLLTIQLL